MELMLNELSIHGQFYDVAKLQDALNRIVAMRKLVHRFGREIYCHRGTLNRPARAETPLIQMLPREQQRAIRVWFDRGPFWDESSKHDSDDLFGCNDEVVTDFGLAESAYSKSIGFDRRMVSVSPSEWNYTPITVNWIRQNGAQEEISVCNYWDYSTLKVALEQSASPPKSWRELEDAARKRFVNLKFTPDSFSDLEGRSFHPANVPNKILQLLDVLDRIMRAGLGSKVGQDLHAKRFQGDKAWFSDSSDREKNNRKFKEKLTFNVADTNDYHFCTWHGKVATPHGPIRIHFTWPVPPGGQLYVVYVGDKLTRR